MERTPSQNLLSKLRDGHNAMTICPFCGAGTFDSDYCGTCGFKPDEENPETVP